MVPSLRVAQPRDASTKSTAVAVRKFHPNETAPAL
jgi:hypothetical protein